ncbi:MAG: DUF3015 family protein [Oligoflexia bacterium]|nr:DUF3015 family protein [Oligoflexia bacterium]
MRFFLFQLGIWITLLLLATTAPATATASPTSAPYGVAGCGLGSMIFGNQSGVVQIFAATSNTISGAQTFGISSGTSNCAENVGAATSSPIKRATTFIEANKAFLASDIAKGAGETIDSLLQIYGITNTSGIGDNLKKNYKTIFSSEVASEINAQIVNIIYQ